MRLWQPSPDEPELFDWWRPLLIVSRLVREERVPWPVHVDEFTFSGRVERGRRPAIWVYEHKRSGGEVLVDWSGQTYEFIRYRTGRQLGRFKEIEVRSAVWRARLPDFVEPVWYDAPRPAPVAVPDATWGTDSDDDEEAAALDVPVRAPERSRGTRRKRHLYLVPPLPNLN
jgi:hypothetical protein